MNKLFPKDCPLWLKELLSNFATKDDLTKFATKEDLKRFATKEDLTKFATKEDLTKFATKDDLTKFRDSILTAIVEVFGEVKDMREEQTLIAHRLSEHTDTLQDHDARISKLESPNLQ